MPGTPGTPKYKNIECVPHELRREILEAYERGAEIEDLAQRYELAPDWIKLFVAEIEGEG
jgi:hypothetical protein